MREGGSLFRVVLNCTRAIGMACFLGFVPNDGALALYTLTEKSSGTSPQAESLSSSSDGNGIAQVVP
jgi:hypothetical protein